MTLSLQRYTPRLALVCAGGRARGAARKKETLNEQFGKHFVKVAGRLAQGRQQVTAQALDVAWKELAAEAAKEQYDARGSMALERMTHWFSNFAEQQGGECP